MTPSSKYEVEQKFPLSDEAALLAKLESLGGVPGETKAQVDCYYAHPARDFAATDEALRIRRVGELSFITYKGPKLDPITKTRREIELPLPPGAQMTIEYARLLKALGFRPVAEVHKQRRVVALEWQARTVEVAIDNVQRVGRFVELELSADESDLDAARAALAALALTLGLSGGERRSYLEMLLEA
ncbi:MAG TPA: class IV adenylate cyclase [Pirellulales bacterium]|nr:class IV adenylate cyclase [Pirellulales bacterium]